MKMPPPIESIARILLRAPAFFSTVSIGTISCGALSTAMTPISSIGESRSSTCTVPRSARSILIRPPLMGAAMLPERSSATEMASDILRCSRRISIETGMTRSSGDLK